MATEPAPTDAEAWQVLLDMPEQENEQAVVGHFARAVLARWGAQPAPAASPVPLTDEQLWANDEIMSLNADLGWHMDTIRMFARVIERAHGITKGA